MATYEFLCRPCGDVFEVSRPMAVADAPTACPSGHTDTKRLLSVFASTGAASPGSAPSMGGGGCCGGACGCG